MKYKTTLFENQLNDMESCILHNLLDLKPMHVRSKYAISKSTGIPEDVLTVLLRRLKHKGLVELGYVFDEITGLPNGSGYMLSDSTTVGLYK